MELNAYQAYCNPELEISYWRTSTGYEVDFILGDMQLAIEVKGSQRVHFGHLRGVKALLEEHKVRKAIVVSLDKSPRKIAPAFEVLPWQYFLEALWSGDLGV
jgi:predicted AAA+ superfamily ATPase